MSPVSMSTSTPVSSSASTPAPDAGALVPDIQAERLIDGLAEAVAAEGYHATKIVSITSHSGLSRSTFYGHFSSKDDCFLFAFEAITSRMAEGIAQASDAAGDWPEAVKRGITAALRFLAAEPNYARLCIVEAINSTPDVTARYEEVMVRRLTPFLDPQGIDLPGEKLAELPQTLRDTIAGGILWIIYQSIVRGDVSRLEGLAPELIEFTLTPYLGAERARRLAHENLNDEGSSVSILHLLRSADLIRGRHPAPADAPKAFELIREDRER